MAVPHVIAVRLLNHRTTPHYRQKFGGNPIATPIQGAAAMMTAMNESQTEALARLLQTREIGALGTLHDGEPFVSMVPFAVLPDAGFVIHVSRLAAHTKDMLVNPA